MAHENPRRQHGEPEAVADGTRSLRFGYHSNGFACHDIEAMGEMLAHLGYHGIALTLDHHHLDPRQPDALAKARQLAKRLAHWQLDVVVETGARFTLDPLRKHEPSLVSAEAAGRQRRLALLERCVEIAAALGAPVIALFAGRVDGAGHVKRHHMLERLAAGLDRLLEAARDHGVTLALEPEPGHAVETLAHLDALHDLLAPGLRDNLGLTLDLGHVLASESPDVNPEHVISERAPSLRHVHIEDALRGHHVHLPFGEGTLDTVAALAALHRIDYRGLVAVELSRHSHEAPLQARRSIEHLRSAEAQARERAGKQSVCPGATTANPKGAI